MEFSIDQFELEGVLGAGNDGIVLKVGYKGILYVIKIMSRFKDILPKVDKIVAINLSLFVRLYATYHINNLPDEWTKAVQTYMKKVSKNEKFSLIAQLGKDKHIYVYEYGGNSLLNYLHGEDEWNNLIPKEETFTLPILKGICFEVLYALWWSYVNYEFDHGDLHIANICILPSEEQRIYNINNTYYKIRNIFKPRLIDYDKAQFGKQNKEPDGKVFLHGFFGGNFSLSKDCASFLRQIYFSELPIPELLLTYFQEYIFNPEEEPSVKRIKDYCCQYCHTNVGILQQCGACLSAIYCGEICQEKDWYNGHILDCIGKGHGGGKGRRTTQYNKAKFAYVLREFHKGKLHTPDGKVVTDKDQALAIAYSESKQFNL